MPWEAYLEGSSLEKADLTHLNSSNTLLGCYPTLPKKLHFLFFTLSHTVTFCSPFLLQYLRHRSEKWTKLVRADVHHQQAVLRRALSAWKVWLSSYL